uniref:RING-type domain-containing protein n=1 Tax=Vannella robusta TaxID=1487602 RepID=A0A7S4II00_9EUKA
MAEEQVECLEIDPELLQFLMNDPSYVICPHCNNVWENAGAGNEDDCRHVKTDNGKPLSAECRRHYTEHRFRCQRCESIFCSECKRIPYHLGYTCEDFENAMQAFKCRWCKDPIPADNIASTGPPKDPQRLVCAKCTDKDSACLNKVHTACGHPAIWHHSMPSRKMGDCIRPECVEARKKNEEAETTSEDLCAICWVEELGEHPCLKLTCGHIFHAHCIKDKLKHRWEAGAAVSLTFLECPLCKAPIHWPAVCQPHVNDLRELKEMRADLKIRCLEQLKQIELPEEFKGVTDDEKLFDYAMHKLNFYECFKCKSFYYGGKKECDQQVEEDEEKLVLKPEELVCGGCRGSCEIHGSEQMVYKCRFCCSVASYFCFGHTHFCPECHAKPWDIVSQNNYQFIVGNLKACEGPDTCPLGVEHPPNGEEFVLGCAYCGEFVHLPSTSSEDPLPPKKEEASNE